MKALTVNGKFDQATKKRMQKWLKVKEDGSIGTKTVKALQKKVKAKVDGNWGKGTTKKLQKYLNQYGKAGLTVDGSFGTKSKKALQRYLNKVFKKQIDPKPAPKPTPKPTPATTNAQKIVAMAKKCAWPYGTSKSKYRYPGGSATADFKKAIAKAYPDRSKWGKQTRAGASCDVFVGTVIRCSGVDKKFPRGLDGVLKHMKGNAKWKLTGVKTEKSMKPGDVIYQEYKGGGGHIFVYLGNGKVANAHYNGKTYGITEKFSAMKSASKCKVYNVYRAK